MAIDTPVVQQTLEVNVDVTNQKSDTSATGNAEIIPKDEEPRSQRTPNIRSNRRQNRGRQRGQSDRQRQQSQSDGRQRQDSVGNQLPQNANRQRQDSVGNQLPQSANRQRQDSVGNQLPQSANRQRQDSVGNQLPQSANRQRQDSVGNQGPFSTNRQRQVSVVGQRRSSVTIAERIVVLKRSDMSDDMQKEAIRLALDGLKRFTVERNTAAFVKKEFDQKYGGTWHCIIGKSFGSFVTHEARHFAFFYVDEDAVLLYKTPK